MKKHKILTDFKGSQHGWDQPVQFNAGDVVLLTDYLADIAVTNGFAVQADAEDDLEVELNDGGKVTVVDLKKLNKKQLVEFGKEIGLDLDEAMKKNDMLAAIETANANASAAASTAPEENQADEAAPEVQADAEAPENKQA